MRFSVHFVFKPEGQIPKAIEKELYFASRDDANQAVEKVYNHIEAYVNAVGGLQSFYLMLDTANGKAVINLATLISASIVEYNY